jgi:hypothetical protein
MQFVSFKYYEINVIIVSLLIIQEKDWEDTSLVSKNVHKKVKNFHILIKIL